jgi:hypothetical protein
MAAASPWPLIHTERDALATDLVTLEEDAQRATASRCEQWPVLSLVLAVTGRPAALDDLSGAGLATLRSRF